jgi:ABC-type nitrate/sulfonate/bicarbonate transport system substrate-binding protein
LTAVKVAYPVPGVTMTGFYVAIQEGFAREEGLDAEMVLMTGTLSAQALIAREIDFGLSAGALLAAKLRGAPLKNVFVQVDKPLFYLYAQSDISSMRELADKAVAITSVGDSTHVSALAALQANGVGPDRVTFIANLAGPAVLPALQAGGVAAAVTPPPVDLAAARLGFRNLGFLGDYLEYLTAGLATHESAVRERPATVKAAVRASLKAHRFLQQNREGTVAHMATFLDVSREDASESYERHIRHLTADGLSTPERLEAILANLRKELSLDRPVPVDEAFDLSFARQANAELDRAGGRP